MRSEPESRQQSVLNSHSGGMTGSTIVPRACDDCRRQKKRCTHKSVTVENQNGTSNSPDEPFSVPQAAAYNAAAPQPTSVSDSGVFAGTATDQGTAANVTDSTFLPSTECAQPPSRSGLSTAPLAGQPQSRKRPADLSSMSRDGSSKSARLNEYPEQNTKRSRATHIGGSSRLGTGCLRSDQHLRIRGQWFVPTRREQPFVLYLCSNWSHCGTTRSTHSQICEERP
jgi:hypothetical protein